MLTSEDRKFIHQEIKRAMNVILSGKTGVTKDVETETFSDMFPGMDAIVDRPVMHPFGLASRAPENTISVVGRQGDNFGNRIILGHRDSKRPKDILKGEVVLYNQFGQAMYFREKKIQVGSKTSENPMVLGDILSKFLKNILRKLLDAPNIGVCAVGNVWLNPEVREYYELQIQEFIDIETTNFVSQMVFTERGEKAI